MVSTNQTKVRTMKLKQTIQHWISILKQLCQKASKTKGVQAVFHICQKIKEHTILQAILISVVITFYLELCGRQAMGNAFVYFIGTSPFMFMMNVMIVLLTMCIALFVPKKTFALSVASVIWITLGTVNHIVLGFRTTPLSAIDFEVIKSAFDVIPAYLTPWEIAAIALAVVVVVVLLVLCWRFTKKKKSAYKSATLFSVVVAGVVVSLMWLTLNTELFATDFRNLPRAYRDYGFAYCFTASILETGIHEPMDYSQASVEELQERLNALGDGEGEDTPNVIVVQLESYFDVNLMKNVTFTRNPIPVYTELMKNYSTGKVRVPALGGGTANVEFELLTGMSLDFFSAGEYPYTSILQESTCESMAYNLKERGYATHAIHNHKGTFYDRHLVYGNLGFDNYVSVENMEPLEYTPRNWEKDGILADQIIKCMDSTEGQDFVFTVTVQAHGKYPTNRRSFIRHVRAERTEGETKEEKKRRHQMEYYANQIYETDMFIGDLIEKLEQRNEPVVVLFYGDHLPALDLSEDDLTDGNLYQTDYVIWDNLGWEKEDKFMHCYQMGSHLMERLGFSNGMITKYHQVCENDSYYYENLGVLEYDMLYGKRYIYGQKDIPHQPTDLRYGLEDVVITDVMSAEDGTVTVYGENFTTHSKIFINEDKQEETIYIDEHTLTLSGRWLEAEDIIRVGQVATEVAELNSSQEYIYLPPWLRE